MKVYTDAARDDSVAGMGWEIYHDDEVVTDSRFLIGEYTSMEAEYLALLDGIRYARRIDTSDVEVYVDCEPLVEKMRVPDAYSQDWFDRRRGCHRLLNKFDNWKLNWKPRSLNKGADRLAYNALERGRQSRK